MLLTTINPDRFVKRLSVTDEGELANQDIQYLDDATIANAAAR